MTEPTDLFDDPPGSEQLSLFGIGEKQAPSLARNFTPDPEVIRHRLTSLLEQARQSEVMPWPAAKARMWQTVFPQMADWLPDEEAAQLRFEFATEIERLNVAA